MNSTGYRSILMAVASLLLGMASATASPILDIGTNGTLATAQYIGAGSFSTGAKTNVPNAGVSGWEWVSIEDSATRTPSPAYYRFDVSVGQTYIFDIDFGDENKNDDNAGIYNFDSLLELFDVGGFALAGTSSNNDAPLPADPGSENSSTFSDATYDSYLTYTFLFAGQAVLKLTDDGSAFEYGTYELQIARVVPVPAAVWLFGTALIGFVGMSRRTSVKS